MFKSLASKLSQLTPVQWSITMTLLILPLAGYLFFLQQWGWLLLVVLYHVIVLNIIRSMGGMLHKSVR